MRAPRQALLPSASETITVRQPHAAPGSPDVVVVVLDDTGFGQLGCFGSPIETPHIDRLSAGGLRYNRFHVTALCSPTRACLLTGRNHHAVGMGFLADIPLAYPGYTARLPPEAATLPRVLRDAGYAALAVGKWHLVPRFERTAAGPFTSWPLGVGFERYYGFLQGDTNQWTPNLVSDNHYVEPPAAPEEGYHLSEDLVDQACRQVLDVHQAAPGKPYFLYLAFGAAHAPHHVRAEWVEPYRGRFDHGWEALRDETFGRQLASGIVPPGSSPTERPPWVPSWSSLPEGERRMHARMHEVFAGFLSHTDAQIGRLISFLEGLGRLDNTLVLLLSDNGASAEGGVAGSVNEHRFTMRVPESVDDNLAAIDDWGGFDTYNHYSWGWAWAGNTPFRLWKRYTWLGGTRTPLVVHWPQGIAGSGTVRPQFAHAVDLMPTVLEACGVEAPDEVDGVPQQPIDGSSLRPTFDDGDAPAPRSVQYFEMLGSRSIISDRWKATTDHVSQGVLDEEELMVGSRDFAEDHWALFDLDHDFSEAEDVSSDHPLVVTELEGQWFAEAGRNQVLPIDDSLLGRMAAMIWPAYPPGATRHFVSGGPIHDEALPLLMGGFRALAEVEVPPSGAAGVIFALGDHQGGLALFVADGRLSFCYSHAGLTTTVQGDRPVPTGRHRLSVSHVPAGPEETGAFALYHDEDLVGTVPFAATLSVALQHGGAQLRIGHDVPFAVSAAYRPPARWEGELTELVIETPGGEADLLTELRAALHSD